MQLKARISHIEARSLVDGPGTRTVVFFQGCPLACPGCQNKHLWPDAGGRLEDIDELAETVALLAANGNVTLSGGDPFHQPKALAHLVTALRKYGGAHIVVYSGYTWEELHQPTHPAYPWLKTILEQIDVLVDGRFVKALDHDFLAYRGSSNQRPIDVVSSLTAGDLVVLDWDNELQISETGDLVLPLGFARDFADIGSGSRSRMCGETRRIARKK